MEKNKCKLCSRSFMNGRALGGHMRSHLATFPLPPKDTTFRVTESDSSSTRSLESATRNANANSSKVGFYELRDKPRKSVKVLDPEFLDEGSIVVVQDIESETESTPNPTRKRSKRVCRVNRVGSTESTPVSSVSDPSQDEEVALCLMMLSRDVWEKVVTLPAVTRPVTPRPKPRPVTRTVTRPVARFKCLECKKVFRTGRALDGHKASNKQCCKENCVGGGDQKIFECPFCSKVFGSGQALGGHKRSHLLGSSTNNNVNVATNIVNSNEEKVGDTTTTTTTTTSFILDLNMPAPIEDDEDYACQVDFDSTLGVDFMQPY